MRFTNAPVAEVVVGVSFKGKPISNREIINFYQEIKDNFPIIEHQPPLPVIIESLNEISEHRVLNGSLVRNLFVNDSHNKLIQIQPDKLLFNWRKAIGNQEYPHFAKVFNEFNLAFGLLKKMNNLSPIQLEVTYVDHIFLDEFGLQEYNLESIFSFFGLNRKLKDIDLVTSYPMVELGAVVNIGLRSAKLNNDGRKLLVLETTCRGINESVSFDKWFDEAHKELLSLFAEITTANAKHKWGLL